MDPTNRQNSNHSRSFTPLVLSHSSQPTAPSFDSQPGTFTVLNNNCQDSFSLSQLQNESGAALGYPFASSSISMHALNSVPSIPNPPFCSTPIFHGLPHGPGLLPHAAAFPHVPFPFPSQGHFPSFPIPNGPGLVGLQPAHTVQTSRNYFGLPMAINSSNSMPLPSLNLPWLPGLGQASMNLNPDLTSRLYAASSTITQHIPSLLSSISTSSLLSNFHFDLAQSPNSTSELRPSKVTTTSLPTNPTIPVCSSPLFTSSHLSDRARQSESLGLTNPKMVRDHVMDDQLGSHHSEGHPGGSVSEPSSCSDSHTCSVKECGRSFLTQSGLTRHAKTHRPTRLICAIDDCDREFENQGALRRHRSTHRGEKPFECRFDGCSRRFADATNAKRHELTHVGDKPFLCSVEDCHKRFARRSAMRNHLSNVHKLGVNSPHFTHALLRAPQSPSSDAVNIDQTAIRPKMINRSLPLRRLASNGASDSEPNQKQGSKVQVQLAAEFTPQLTANQPVLNSTLSFSPATDFDMTTTEQDESRTSSVASVRPAQSPNVELVAASVAEPIATRAASGGLILASDKASGNPATTIRTLSDEMDPR